MDFKQYASHIWAVADLLRGDYKQADYGKVILPLTVLRRLDSVLAPTKAAVLAEYPRTKNLPPEMADMVLNQKSGLTFYNHSPFDFDRLVSDPNNVAANLRHYINGFSQNAREILEHFEFDHQITKLDSANLLFMVLKKFQEIDLHPSKVKPITMGYIFEELIRKFAESSNETAGEHFTPREVIRLMVNLLFLQDRDILTKKGIVKTIYDPACGTGGMLSVAEEYLHELNDEARLEAFGQELNPESYAICKADMLIKGHRADNIKLGNSFTQDQLPNAKFDYLLSNPPFGVEWKKSEKAIKEEHDKLGHAGRFGAGLPRISDGSLLFLQHMVSKMKNTTEGSRLAIVFNGSPLFSGSAGSGESEIRRWLLERDMLESIVALPDQLFYNTGISTYIWIITNRKSTERIGKVQLVNGISFYQRMAKSLGDKRLLISPEQISEITRIYGDFSEGEYSKIFRNEDFGYRRITVERPLRDINGQIVTGRAGIPKPDASLRDFENVPLLEDPEEYFQRENLPYTPDAFIDHTKTREGYEISFTRYFYQYNVLRSLSEIRKDILKLEAETEGLLQQVIK
ncbi:type I restriction-modification system subunit M [Hymenobacter convexus]|uniref:type I restriction-modification system subunit M n=1 Tax=Hymenobacter sp. CA1UV-4 TaxID=3063782 RepID=UPI002712F574|nr:class I SAM-dependent DNA methyltransferase [Hymenobacter sp. CA1UV-4]MDO7853423.1 class I SAM-dependent DNA methyltransferase [Hymenobacter sp. CA1UV-4]